MSTSSSRRDHSPFDRVGVSPDQPSSSSSSSSSHRHSNSHLMPNSDFQTTNTLTRRRVPSTGPQHFPTSEMDLTTYNQQHQASVHAPGAHLYNNPVQKNSRSSSSDHSSDMDLSTYPHHQNHPHVLPRQHEMRRPDSVITTSSIVSSDTADESQTGDGIPHNVYTISGLYGANSKAKDGVKNTLPLPQSIHETPPSSLTSGSEVTTATTHSSLGAASDLHLITTVKGQQQPQTRVVKTHRRQASHPGHFDSCLPPMACRNSSAVPNSNNLLVMNTQQQHRRSNSYGHHKALTGTTSLGSNSCNHGPQCWPRMHHQHRRTGSSVIETLQHTLACTGVENEVITREEAIAQFLENLKKEQQEKFERQELHEMQDELEDLRDCGMGGCRPKFIQPLANIKFFVFLLSMLVTLQQALSSGYLNSVITTIEKRYEIPSSISGIIASMYEIGNVGTVIFVSYLGSRRHIPVWIGMGVLVMGIGSIMFSLPHFLSDHYMVHSDLNTTVNNICKPSSVPPQKSQADNLLAQITGLDKLGTITKDFDAALLSPHNSNLNREDNCIEQANESAAMPIFIFMVAQLLLGCGGSPLFTLGTTYIDNHVKRDDSSMYIGIMYSMCAFGPVCGFLLGAYLLSHYVDTFSIDIGSLRIDSSDRHWIGMWWGGFLICGVSLILISIPFFFFPKELKKEKVKVYIDEKYHHASDPSIRPKHRDNMANNEAISKASSMQRNVTAPTSRSTTLNRDQAPQDNNYGKDIKDIPRCTWKLLTNKIYIVTCLGACMELIIVSGFIVFLPKYLETQFNLSKSTASMFTGGIAIPGACIGIFLGGYILKRLQLRPKGAVQLVIFFNMLCLSFYAMLFIFGCDNVKMAGTTMPYFNSLNKTEPFKINLTASCNFGCECDMNDVQPVCGANGLTYFSPCHAGCTSLGSNGGDNYTDCACVLSRPVNHGFSAANPLLGVDHDVSISPEVTMVPVATAGPCYSQCGMIAPFMVLLFFMTLVVAVTQMPVLMVVLRAVEEEEKAFALGIQFVIFRLFGYIPSPIVFGNVIDTTCLLWKSTCDGEAGGRCLMYDIEMFRYKYVGVCCGIKLMSLLIFVVDWWLIRNRQNLEKKNAALTVGEVVNSIISLDKLFEPDGPLWRPMTDPENGSESANPDHRARLESEEID